DVALRQQGDGQVLGHFVLADDGIGDLCANGAGEIACLVQVHWAIVLSMVLSAPAARSRSPGRRARRSACASAAESGSIPRAARTRAIAASRAAGSDSRMPSALARREATSAA